MSGPDETPMPAARGLLPSADRRLADRVEQARGRLQQDQLRRQGPALFAPARPPGTYRILPPVVYHGTRAVLDRYPSGTSNWFTWDLDSARSYSGSAPGSSLVYRYVVENREARDLLVLRHRGEFSKPLVRLMAEQQKVDVDGWIELEPGVSLMLARPARYLRFDGVMGLLLSKGSEGDRSTACWSGWRRSVEQIEAESGARPGFPRGRRGIGNLGAYDRLLAGEIARNLTGPMPSGSHRRPSSFSGSRP